MIYGEIVAIDEFGNIITNISEDYIKDTTQIELTIKNRKLNKISKTYQDAKPGTLLAYIGSSGYIEIAVNKGNAAKKLHAKVRDKVELKAV